MSTPATDVPNFADVLLSESIYSIEAVEVTFKPDNIPVELRELPNWVCWSKIKNSDTSIPTKVPTIVKDRMLQKLSWGQENNRKTFEDACAEMQRYPDWYHGVGYIFQKDDPYTFIDIDKLEDNDPRLDDLEGLDSYVELSQSGKGVHAIVRASLRKQVHTDQIEIYPNTRFSALTGSLYGEHPTYITEQQDLVDTLAAKYRKKEDEYVPLEGILPGDFNYRIAMEQILVGEQLHSNIRDIAASQIAMGVPVQKVIDLLQGAMLAAEPNIEATRWRARFEDIPRVVKSAVDKFGKTKDRAEHMPSLESLSFTVEDAKNAPLHPPELVKNHLYADVRVLGGGGGLAKTTLTALELLYLAVGKDLYGLEELPVTRPYRSLFITAEDAGIYLKARLYRLAKANDIDPAKAFKNIYILDSVGKGKKLVSDQERMLAATEFAKGVAGYQEVDHIVFDPLVSFGADEERVNTNMQALVDTARHIMRETGALVTYIHHTGQESARGKVADAYALRGGSALPDGARMVSILTPPADDSKTAKALIEDVKRELHMPDSAKVVVCSRPKITYAPPDQPAIWFVRDGWHVSAMMEPQHKEDITKRARDRDDAALLSFIQVMEAAGQYPIKANLEQRRGEIVSGFTVKDFRESWARLDGAVAIVEKELPVEFRSTSRKVYFGAR